MGWSWVATVLRFTYARFDVETKPCVIYGTMSSTTRIRGFASSASVPARRSESRVKIQTDLEWLIRESLILRVKQRREGELMSYYCIEHLYNRE